MGLLIGFVLGEVFAASAIIAWGLWFDRSGCPCRQELVELESPQHLSLYQQRSRASTPGCEPGACRYEPERERDERD